MKRVIIIGAGASGLMAAVTAAGNGAQVTVLEASEKPGRKILITGNGRCNLTNTDYTREDCYRCKDPDFVRTVLQNCSFRETLDSFRLMGLLTHDRNGYVYPLSDQASSVLEVLLTEARKRKVKVKCKEKVISLKKEGSIWKVHTESWCYEADSVILAAGSKAFPVTGSDGSGYLLAKEAGLKVFEPSEALVPLTVKDAVIRKAAGVRTSSKVRLDVICSGSVLNSYSDQGEIQWTDYGVSGIVIFQLSRYAVLALREKKQAVIHADLLPSLTEEAIFGFLKGRTFGTISEAFSGLLNKKMAAVILEKLRIKPGTDVSDLSHDQLRNISNLLKDLSFEIKGSKSFEQAQVCAGGVDVREIDPDTMMTKTCPGLYVTGELTDVDGICGGYNLQWAWSTGMIAGRAASE